MSTGNLKKLGNDAAFRYNNPTREDLESFPNPHPGKKFNVNFTTEDFTSLCPKTGQPDYARVEILYIPHDRCIETKSLKMYLQSYRMYQGFMEDITNKITDDIAAVVDPRWIGVTLYFSCRGGIDAEIQAVRGDPNSEYSISDQEEVDC